MLQTQLVRVSPYEVKVFPTDFFSLQNVLILRGKERPALFKTYNWEKPSFLGPLGPCVLPSVGPSVRPSALKICITYIQAYMP